jgi:acetate---CoA ligase (ADP-forming)
MSDKDRITPEQLHRFLRPRSIVLVGATDNSRWSISTFENLQRFEFPGPIYLVNPKRAIVHGQPAVPSLRNLPEPTDLAFVMVPTQHVFSVVEEAAEMGTKHFVILTAGYREVGEAGARLEQELLTFAQERGLTLLGPNGNGFINVTERITPYGLAISPPLVSGPVGVVLQSGALASAVLSFAQAHAIGLSLLVSMGNESMISTTDVVDYLIEDDATHAIALFLESIRHPEELRRVANKARERHKPIIALKIGRSEMSTRTALAHTGALVGNDAINDAAFKQLGIVRVESLEDLLLTAGLAGYHHSLPGRRMGVVTPSGGACDIISDLAQDEGIVLPEFATQTVERLQEILPSFSTAHNPLDVTGYIVVDGTLQTRALDVVVNDPNIDFILFLTSLDGRRVLEPSALANLLGQYDQLAETIKAAHMPIVLVSNTGIDLTPTGQAVVERTGLHVVAGMKHGVHAIGRLLWWSEQLNTPIPDSQTILQLTASAITYPRRGNWSEARARLLLQEADIPVVPGNLATSPEEAVQAARALGFPVALKIQSAALPHKSDVGGVALNEANEQAVRAGFMTMIKRVQAHYPDIDIEGILVSTMRPPGTELLVSVVRDPLWGPVLTLGLGGIWTEALKDTIIRILPVEREDIRNMLGELRGATLLLGGRGRAPVDLPALVDVIYHISTLALSLGPDLNTLEINPLLISTAGIEVLDVLLSWCNQEPL